jgi:hypothetical protein
MDYAWLSPDAAAMVIGSAGGSLIVLCALFGGFSRWLAQRGEGKVAVAGGFAVLGLVGLGSLAIGVVAALSRQPAYLWFPLVVIGAAVLGARALGLPGIVVRYRRAKKRRDMQALAEHLVAGTSSRMLARISGEGRRWR